MSRHLRATIRLAWLNHHTNDPQDKSSRFLWRSLSRHEQEHLRNLVSKSMFLILSTFFYCSAVVFGSRKCQSTSAGGRGSMRRLSLSLAPSQTIHCCRLYALWCLFIATHHRYSLSFIIKGALNDGNLLIKINISTPALWRNKLWRWHFPIFLKPDDPPTKKNAKQATL